MPRHPRVFVEPGFYHVFNHRTGGESPYLGRDEAEGFVARVREASTRDGFSVFAWCLMSNHYHLVLRTREVPLCRSLLLIQERADSCLECGRLSREEEWLHASSVRRLSRRRALDAAVAYVHLNPVAAGLTPDPARYRWSGHRELMGLEQPCLVDVRVALARFGTRPLEARRAYLELLRREHAGTRPGQRSWQRQWWREAWLPPG